MGDKNKIRAVFLDRDDTIIEDPGYITKPEQLKLLPGTGAALRRLRLLGYKLFVVTNQSAVARGMISEENLEVVHNKLLSMLDREGVQVDKIYYCPHHPDGVVDGFNKECQMRKPAPGMLFAARDEMDIDLENSWMIGDKYRDIAAGKAAGCRCILINPPMNPRKRKDDEPEADYKAVNITEAANIIKMFHQRQSPQPPAQQMPQVAATSHNQQNHEQDQPRQINRLTTETLESAKFIKEIKQTIKAALEAKSEYRFSTIKAVCGLLTAFAGLSVIIALIRIIGAERGDLSPLKPLCLAMSFQLMAIMLYIVKKDSE